MKLTTLHHCNFSLQWTSKTRETLTVEPGIMEQMLALSTQNPFSLLIKFGMMAWNNSACGVENCSGHGECHNGTCLCEIQFDGPQCHTPNISYYMSFSIIFFIIAFVCLTQLVMCILAEWKKLKKRSVFHACRMTTQKLLYLIVFFASLIRGAYFTSLGTFLVGWSRSLLSAYYPLLLTGSSLIVCFWAEAFHLRNVHTEKPQFLSKSFLAFVVFNIIAYSLLLAEFVTVRLSGSQHQDFYTHVFNGCYAILLFIVIIFYLIYGVEVYFKVRGEFLNQTQALTITTRNRTINEPCTSREASQITEKLFEPIIDNLEHLQKQEINTSQLHQSRIGLLSQAFMLFFVVGFLFSETLGQFWKTKVPLYSRNCHDIIFRLIEVGVILWFPCVLWNCTSPEKLWILNPKKIVKKFDLDQDSQVNAVELQNRRKFTDSDISTVCSKECWICYDSDRRDAGVLIHPCQCQGDLSAVHHNCLRRWLVESSSHGDSRCCKVCRAQYNVETANRFDWQNSLSPRHWLQTIILFTIMCISSAASWVLIQYVNNPIMKTFAAGMELLIIYVCIKFLSFNTIVAYHKAKISSVTIVNRETNSTNRISLTTTEVINS